MDDALRGLLREARKRRTSPHRWGGVVGLVISVGMLVLFVLQYRNGKPSGQVNWLLALVFLLTPGEWLIGWWRLRESYVEPVFRLLTNGSYAVESVLLNADTRPGRNRAGETSYLLWFRLKNGLRAPALFPVPGDLCAPLWEEIRRRVPSASCYEGWLGLREVKDWRGGGNPPEGRVKYIQS